MSLPKDKDNNTSKRLIRFYDSLFADFGPQGWWPGNTRFEIIVGAILTQNTSWGNVEKAIKRLKAKKLLTPEAMLKADLKELAEEIRPAGYFNIKSKRLRNFLDHLFENHNGSLDRLFRKDPGALREELLSINGIGPETADSIILYAAGKPEFVVDAYTRRIMHRHGLAGEDIDYERLKSIFRENLPPDTALFNEYHALIVKTGKDYCKTKEPRCNECPLGKFL